MANKRSTKIVELKLRRFLANKNHYHVELNGVNVATLHPSDLPGVLRVLRASPEAIKAAEVASEKYYN